MTTSETSTPDPESGAPLAERLKGVKLVVLDVDGTLTDGSIYLGEHEEVKRFHVADGLGIKLLMRSGIEVAILTSRRSGAVGRRASELGVTHVFQGVSDKVRSVTDLARKLGLGRDEIAAMGDDLNDLAVLQICGVRFAVRDAASEVRQAADWVSTRPGGHGAAREAAELILKAQGQWKRRVAEFSHE